MLHQSADQKIVTSAWFWTRYRSMQRRKSGDYQCLVKLYKQCDFYPMRSYNRYFLRPPGTALPAGAYNSVDSLAPDQSKLSSKAEPGSRSTPSFQLGHLTTRLTVFLGLWLVVTSLQWWSGAFTGAFGSQPDEPSHYVTGVMIRDYIAAGFPWNPIQFAENFYLHYPRVAFGIWPPLFHLAYGAWMFIFGDHRQSVLALVATVTASWGYLFFRILHPRFGFALSFMAALLLISLPAVQISTLAVMLDMAAALAVLAAMIRYAKYLETESDRDAILFGLVAGLAAMVKYNGLVLVLLPPLCVLLTGRYYLLRRKSFWLPAAVVLAIAGPWYVIMRRWVSYAAEPGGAQEYWNVAAGNAIELIGLGGPVLFAVGIMGAALAIRNSRRRFSRHPPGDWQTNLHISAVGILGASWLFHSFLYPIIGSRYLLPAAASLILLALPALDTAVRSLRPAAPAHRRFAMLAGMALLILPYAAFAFHVPRKNTQDFAKVADRVLAEALPANSVILVASDGVGEGMFVSEIAMRGPRPRYFVARSSKFLATQTLMGEEYRSLFGTGRELMEALDRVPVSIVVIDEPGLEQSGRHGQLLVSLTRGLPERWELLHTLSKESGGHIRTYRLKGNERKPFNRLSIDMRYTLGRSIGAQAEDDERRAGEQ
jgi:4-amino-4-deoxy-L-arabinose transferase-like glycosyltransferase